METRLLRWYAGIAVRERRSFSAEEHREIRAVGRELTLRILFRGLSSLLLVGVVLFASLWSATAISVLIALAALSLLVFPLRESLLSKFIRLLQLRIRLNRDLEDRVVDICSGLVEDVVSDHLAVFGTERILPGTMLADTLQFEVLPKSHLLWRRDGRHVSDIAVVRAANTAPAPPHAAMAANFVKPIDGEERLFVHERPMSAEEQTELHGYARKPQLEGIFVSSMCAIAAALSALVLDGASRFILPLVLVVLSIAWAVVPFVRRIRIWRLFGADAREGRVVIVRQNEAEDPGEMRLSPAEEFLPYSRILWSRDSSPASWRKMFLADAE